MAAALFQGLNHALLYSKFRPQPPAAIVEKIIDYLKCKLDPPFKLAVDLGCGSGQSTKILSPYFQNVIGLDISEAQIKYAREDRSAPNIEYRVSDGGNLQFPESSVDLATFSQSLHWFDRKKVFDDINKILVPGGVIAAYGYWIPKPQFDNEEKTRQIHHLVIEYMYEEQLGQYWDKQRRLIENQYLDIQMPFEDCFRTNYFQESTCTLADYIGYISSWSAFHKLRDENIEQANNLLETFQEKFISIIETDQPLDKVPLKLLTDYFITLGRKSSL